jgi:hypothetical protein
MNTLLRNSEVHDPNFYRCENIKYHTSSTEGNDPMPKHCENKVYGEYGGIAPYTLRVDFTLQR